MADVSSTPTSCGFSLQVVSQALLTCRRRCSRIDQELSTTGFSFRYRKQPLCRVGWRSFTLIGLYQHPSDWWFGRSVRSCRDRRLQRCSVLPAPGALIPPAILLRMLPGLASKTVFRKVLGRFSIGFSLAFALLVFVFVLLCCSRFSCLWLYPSSRDPWAQHHQRPYPLCARQLSNSIVLTCA